MSKDHFPVNDKTIADVNKANARAYSADAQRTAVGITRVTNTPAKSYSAKSEGGNHPDPKVRATKGPGYMKRAIQRHDPFQKSGDHVRESSQEKGEAHDAAGFTGYVHSRHEGGHKLIEGAGKNGGQWAVVTKGKHAGTYSNKTDAMGHIEAESD